MGILLQEDVLENVLRLLHGQIHKQDYVNIHVQLLQFLHTHKISI